MEENLNNDVNNLEEVQESNLNSNGNIGNLTFEDEFERKNLENKDLSEEQKKQSEQELLKQINKEIQKNLDKIENIELKLREFEGGKLFAKVEEEYNAGEISEEEYLQEIDYLDLEHGRLIAEKADAEISLSKLIKKRDEIRGIKEKNEVEEKIQNDKLIDSLGDDEKKVQDTKQKSKEDKSSAESSKEDKSSIEGSREDKSQIESLEKEKKESINQDFNDDKQTNTQGAPVQQGDFVPPHLGDNIQNVQETQLDVYKNTNRFVGFFKNIVKKIRNFVGLKNNEEIENIAVSELNNEGIQIGNREFRESTLGEELRGYICNEEEIIHNMNRRESQEVDEVQVTRKIDGNMI